MPTKPDQFDAMSISDLRAALAQINQPITGTRSVLEKRLRDLHTAAQSKEADDKAPETKEDPEPPAETKETDADPEPPAETKETDADPEPPAEAPPPVRAKWDVKE